MITREDLRVKYGFPDAMIDALKDRRIDTLLLPQEVALNSGLLEGRSLIISAGSSTGKTLIAELAITKLSSTKKALFLVPLKSIADDKYFEFKKYYSKLLSIGISTHDRNEFDDNLDEFDVLIATYEKADILLRSDPNWAKSIGLVIVDEVHHIGDENRGPTLELMITTLLKNNQPQLLLLSATVAEPETFQRWIGGDSKVLNFPDYRPVPLRMGVLFQGKIAYDDGGIEDTSFGGRLDSQLIQIVAKEVEASHQVIVFAYSRYRAQQYADLLAKTVGNMEVPNLKRLEETELKKFVEEEAFSTDIEPDVLANLRNGVAYHHAGLTESERQFIQDSFKSRRLAVVCATTSLGEGVNYPADMTIFTSLMKGEQELSVNDFKNMAGRAGRIGYVDVGVALVMALTQRMANVALERYVKGPPQAVVSQLMYENELRRNLLILIATGQFKSSDEIIQFLSQTYYARSTGLSVSKELLSRLHDGLEAGGFVIGYRATELGRVCASRRYDPLFIQRILEGFRLAQKENRPVTDFALLHLVCSTVDFEAGLCNILPWEKGAYVGAALERSKEIIQTTYNDQVHLERVLKTALVLEAWIEGRSTSQKFRVYPSDVQTHQAATATWLASAIPNCLEAAGLPVDSALADQIGDLLDQLRFGVPKKFVNAGRTFAVLGFDPLSRNRLMLLGEQKIDTLKLILDSPPAALAKSLGSPEFAKRVLDRTSQLLNDSQIRDRQALVFEAEKVGFQGPVLRLYSSTNGNDYENAVFRILRMMTKSMTRPPAGASTSPDLIVVGPNGGVISVEIRFANSEIQEKDIGVAIARSMTQSSEATVVVAKRFSAEATEIAKGSRRGAKLTLVTESALVKTLILSKNVDSQALLFSVLGAGGLLTEKDVERLAREIPKDSEAKDIILELADQESKQTVGPKKLTDERIGTAIRGGVEAPDGR